VQAAGGGRGAGESLSGAAACGRGSSRVEVVECTVEIQFPFLLKSEI
jgi:hypothetical protein